MSKNREGRVTWLARAIVTNSGFSLEVLEMEVEVEAHSHIELEVVKTPKLISH